MDNDLIIEHFLTIDIEDTEKEVASIVAKQNNNYHLIHFFITKDDVALDLSDKTVRIYGEKPDGTIIFNNLEITNPKMGKCDYKVTNNALAQSGHLKLEISVYEGQEVVASRIFTIRVKKTLRDDDAIESTNEFGAFTSEIKRLEDLIGTGGGSGVAGSKMIIAESSRIRNYTDSQWKQYISPEDKEGWDQITNINSIKVGDIAVIRGTIADRDKAECFVYGEVINISGNTLFTKNNGYISSGKAGKDGLTTKVTMDGVTYTQVEGNISLPLQTVTTDQINKVIDPLIPESPKTHPNNYYNKEQIDKQNVRYFKNVEEMKADATLKDGMSCTTQGYYEPNDGGGAEYIKHDNQFDIILENGLLNVKQVGAKGDDLTDDTIAIQTALNSNKCVIIPQGKYLISKTLNIPEGTTLELTKGTILDFTLLSGNCINIDRFGNLIGNYAIIFAKYNFDGNVISIDTRLSKGTPVDPFKQWGPQWITNRNIENIEIIKLNENGFADSLDGTCKGNAIYIYTKTEPESSYISDPRITGIKVAGAFKTAFYGDSHEGGYAYDGIFQGASVGTEYGAILKKFDNFKVSIVMQPRKATDGSKYAKQGIRLENSSNIDLSDCAIWDWGAENTLRMGDASQSENQQLAMYGFCIGVKWNSSLDSNTKMVWDNIYYDQIDSINSLTLIGRKGQSLINPKFAFYKNGIFNKGYDYYQYKQSGYDPANLLRLQIPVFFERSILLDGDVLYQIGYFDIDTRTVMPDRSTEVDDAITSENIVIEENNYKGYAGFTNLIITNSNITCKWCPSLANQGNWFPKYYYKKDEKRISLYRLFKNYEDAPIEFDGAFIFMRNTKRFVLDWKRIDKLSALSPSDYIQILPSGLDTTQKPSYLKPNFVGMIDMSGNKPYICTKSATFNYDGSQKTPPTAVELITRTELDTILKDYQKK